MGSANREGTTESSLDLLHDWLGSAEREPGLAVIEDLTLAALPVLMNTSRQSDPAAIPPSPEDDGSSDARGPAGAAQAAPVTASTSPAAAAPVDLSLATGSRRVVGFLLVAALVITVIQLAVAYADPSPVTLGGAALLVLTTIATWRAWARRSATTVVLAGSRLEIVRDGGRHVFDLADTRIPVDVVGLPDDRSWQVLFHRRGMAPYVLDASMVDPTEFLGLLHRHRSEVHYRPR